MLTTAGNKLLLDGFNLVPQTWRAVAAVQNVNDFKEVTAYRLTADLEYEEVGPGGTIEHGTMGQEAYTNQAKTYAKMLTLTRQDIINDDLGAFDTLRKRLGMGAGIKLNRVAWTTWLTASAGGTFWTEARGNLITAVFGETGLTAAVKAFRNMVGPDGNNLSIEPKAVLVPPDLEAQAKKLYVSTEVRDTTTDTLTQTGNIYNDSFKPVAVSELNNDNYVGKSGTAWWLLAPPEILASAAMCFLDGVQNPTIESADADFNTLGISLRGYHDFGGAMSEHRASVKSTGAG
jgi:phage major head subunit gpT-like protein